MANQNYPYDDDYGFSFVEEPPRPAPSAGRRAQPSRKNRPKPSLWQMIKNACFAVFLLGLGVVLVIVGMAVYDIHHKIKAKNAAIAEKEKIGAQRADHLLNIDPETQRALNIDPTSIAPTSLNSQTGQPVIYRDADGIWRNYPAQPEPAPLVSTTGVKTEILRQEPAAPEFLEAADLEEAEFEETPSNRDLDERLRQDASQIFSGGAEAGLWSMDESAVAAREEEERRKKESAERRRRVSSDGFDPYAVAVEAGG